MSIFRDALNLWRSDDLLHQAWDNSYEMLNLSKEMFKQSVKKLQAGDNIETLLALKKRDKEINRYQQDVRRKVLTHYSVEQDVAGLSNGLILVNMVVDIERIGDYAKNIVDLAINYNKSLDSKTVSEDLYIIEDEVINRFDKTLEAIHSQDSNVAESLYRSYKEIISAKSDRLVNDILSGKESFDSAQTAATVALYARYLKRIGAHLKNITSVLVNPFDTIGYIEENDDDDLVQNTSNQNK